MPKIEAVYSPVPEGLHKEKKRQTNHQKFLTTLDVCEHPLSTSVTYADLGIYSQVVEIIVPQDYDFLRTPTKLTTRKSTEKTNKPHMKIICGNVKQPFDIHVTNKEQSNKGLLLHLPFLLTQGFNWTTSLKLEL